MKLRSDLVDEAQGTACHKPAARTGTKLVAAVGYGVLAAGIVLALLAYLGRYACGELNGLADFVFPLTLRNHVPFLSVIPGLLLVWLGSATPDDPDA